MHSFCSYAGNTDGNVVSFLLYQYNDILWWQLETFDQDLARFP